MHLDGFKVIVLPDDSSEADPRLPPDVVEKLEQNETWMNPFAGIMYVRQSTWERMQAALNRRPDVKLL
jgi:hypothetical protein